MMMGGAGRKSGGESTWKPPVFPRADYFLHFELIQIIKWVGRPESLTGKCGTPAWSISIAKGGQKNWKGRGCRKLGDLRAQDRCVSFDVTLTHNSSVILRNQIMATTNADRLKAYKAKMKEAGFTRLSVYVHPDLVAHLNTERPSNECGGRVLERLLLGDAKKRPAPVSGK